MQRAAKENGKDKFSVILNHKRGNPWNYLAVHGVVQAYAPIPMDMRVITEDKMGGALDDALYFFRQIIKNAKMPEVKV